MDHVPGLGLIRARSLTALTVGKHYEFSKHATPSGWRGSLLQRGDFFSPRNRPTLLRYLRFSFSIGVRLTAVSTNRAPRLPADPFDLDALARQLDVPQR